MGSKISAQATLLIYITIDRLQYNELQCINKQLDEVIAEQIISLPMGKVEENN